VALHRRDDEGVDPHPRPRLSKNSFQNEVSSACLGVR
jgi:hypothetical protein